MKITIKKNKAEIEDDGSLVAKLITGCKGKVKIKTPLGEWDIKNAKVEKKA